MTFKQVVFTNCLNLTLKVNFQCQESIGFFWKIYSIKKNQFMRTFFKLYFNFSNFISKKNAKFLTNRCKVSKSETGFFLFRTLFLKKQTLPVVSRKLHQFTIEVMLLILMPNIKLKSSSNLTLKCMWVLREHTFLHKN